MLQVQVLFSRQIKMYIIRMETHPQCVSHLFDFPSLEHAQLSSSPIWFGFACIFAFKKSIFWNCYPLQNVIYKLHFVKSMLHID